MIAKTKKAWSDFAQSLREGHRYLAEKRVSKTAVLIFLIFVMSCLDAVFTLLWIENGLAVEVNPLLASLIDNGSFSFIATKILLTLLGCWGLYYASSQGKGRVVKKAVIVLFVAYTVLIVYHFFGAIVSIDENYIPGWLSDFIVWVS